MFTGEKLPLQLENEMLFFLLKPLLKIYIFYNYAGRKKTAVLWCLVCTISPKQYKKFTWFGNKWIFCCKGMIKCVLYRANFSLICEIKLTY